MCSQEVDLDAAVGTPPAVISLGVQMDAIVVEYRATIGAQGGAGAALAGRVVNRVREVGAGHGGVQGRRIWALLVGFGWVLV